MSPLAVHHRSDLGPIKPSHPTAFMGRSFPLNLISYIIIFVIGIVVKIKHTVIFIVFKSSVVIIIITEFVLAVSSVPRLYVDDLLILGNSRNGIALIKEKFSTKFEMKDLSPAKVMLGIEISRDRKNRRVFISQQQYITEIVKRFKMKESRTVSTPMENSSLSELDRKHMKTLENTMEYETFSSKIEKLSETNFHA